MTCFFRCTRFDIPVLTAADVIIFVFSFLSSFLVRPASYNGAGRKPFRRGYAAMRHIRADFLPRRTISPLPTSYAAMRRRMSGAGINIQTLRRKQKLPLFGKEEMFSTVLPFGVDTPRSGVSTLFYGCLFTNNALRCKAA